MSDPTEPTPYRTSAEPPKQWEIWQHKQVKVKPDCLSDQLEAYGLQGWELVAACRISDAVGYRLFFKRQRGR